MTGNSMEVLDKFVLCLISRQSPVTYWRHDLNIVSLYNDVQLKTLHVSYSYVSSSV